MIRRDHGDWPLTIRKTIQVRIRTLNARTDSGQRTNQRSLGLEFSQTCGQTRRAPFAPEGIGQALDREFEFRTQRVGG